ncbi:MAG TPA: hypothetical protein VHT53_07290 [Candidatus Elarobacter sp.]|nr:hypothetical protein [Candidatus Elarobacter sp.]
MSARAAALALVLALGLPACGLRPGAATMPIGVVAAPQDRGKVLVDGVYASSGDRPDPCCFMQRRAVVRVQKDEPATDLAVEIYVPDIAEYRRRPQSLSVSLDGGPPMRRCCIGPGDHTLLFRLPASLRARTGTLPLALEAGETFVPIAAHVSPDTRTLSVMLIAVTFRSF